MFSLKTGSPRHFPRAEVQIILLKRFLLKPWQAPQCCRCCCSPSYSPFIIKSLSSNECLKDFTGDSTLPNSPPSKILFFFFPSSIRVFSPKTESARRGLACAPRYSLAERAQAVPRRDQNNPRLLTASDPKTLLQNTPKY